MPDRPPRVVVVTGASSGIGLATAELLARRGDRLVLAARHQGDLEVAAQRCRDLGAPEVHVIPTDVGDETAVRELVRAAVEACGRIDGWVGAASVYSYGTLERTPPEVVEQIVRTNLLAHVWTAQALLPQLRAQGGGTIVAVGSLFSRMTAPYVGPYVASKFGLLGLTRSLRQELVGVRGVHVCAVLPATIDTPIYQRAANYTGRHTHPLPPVVSPYRVARAIVRAIDRPRREVVVGQVQRTFVPVQALLPAVFDRTVGPLMDTVALRGGPVPPTPGAVLAPVGSGAQVAGGWRSGRARALGAGAVGAAVAGAALRWVGGRRGAARDRPATLGGAGREVLGRARPRALGRGW